MAPLPDRIRKQLEFEHEVLRVLMRRLSEAAESTLRGEPTVQELRDAQRSLHDVLEVHLRQEEGVLAPVLRAAWTEERLARLHEDHLKALLALRRQRTRAPKQAAAASRRLVRSLLTRMAEEETDLLHDGGMRLH